ncbi:MAG: molybdopterin-guanine dinucleotide biosynthesis protein MobB [Dehalococcoidia bacterium]|nr:molybdopterin-guanine dinucleotide biosynthesis protein MobB [Dehalococcoidia bacterium]
MNGPDDVPALAGFAGPTVIAVRGPSRSGKTALIERLVPLLHAEAVQVAYLKRTHHELDLPFKASGRVWTQRPEAMVLYAPDRLQVSVPPTAADAPTLLAQLPAAIDIALFETHSPEPFPTILSEVYQPAEGERIIGRWALERVDADARAVLPQIRGMLPRDRVLDGALRAAVRLHGGRGCAGLVLGTRLALAGASAIDIAVPDAEHRLLVVLETDRCAADAVQAVTGCRPGRRTLKLLDYGKVAATFVDTWSGRAVRVAARGDLRERASAGAPAEARQEAQRRAYLTWDVSELFEVRSVEPLLTQGDLPGGPRTRVHCGGCGEEVSGGRHVETESGVRCQPCAAQLRGTGMEAYRYG